MVKCPDHFVLGGWEQPVFSQQESTARSFMPVHELTVSQSPWEGKCYFPTFKETEDWHFGGQRDIQSTVN